MAKTLAYYDTATITAVKSFIVQAPRDNDGEKKCYKIHMKSTFFAKTRD